LIASVKVQAPSLRSVGRVCDTWLVPTRWFEVAIEVSPETAEAIANFLIESGAPGIEAQDRDGRVRLIAYFEAAPPLEPLRRYCAALTHLDPGEAAIRVRQVNGHDWAHGWQRYTRAQAVGQTLYIKPSWDSASPPSDRIVLTIDPGMAFGTAQHPTTRGCLELIDAAARRGAIVRALDLGTGSGILAIALAKLGIGEVWAVDTDPAARAVALQNAALNQVSDRLHVTESLADAPAAFSLIVANLYADLLQELAAPLARALSPDGELILSGFLRRDEARVLGAFAPYGLTPEDRRVEDSWVTLSLHRSSAP
jgi:ribosomal protein L11 methyltransferase